MTKPIYKMKTFWCIIAAILLIAICVVVWMVGSVKSAAGSQATILVINDKLYTLSDTPQSGFSFKTIDGKSTLTLTDFSLTTFNQLPNNWGGDPKGNPLYDDVCNEWSLIWANGDLTIDVQGQNNITATGYAFQHYGEEYPTMGIYVDGDLSIIGSGVDTSKLTVQSGMHYGWTSVGIYAAGDITIQDCTVDTGAKQSGGSGQCSGISAAKKCNIRDAKVTAIGGSAIGTGFSDGIYAAEQLNIYGSSEVVATGGTATGGSSTGVRTPDGYYVYMDDGKLTATGGQAAASGQYSVGIQASGVEITSGAVEAYGGTLGTSANAVGVRLTDIWGEGRLFRVNGGNLKAKAAQTVGSGGVSYGIWRNLASNNNENFRVNGGVICAIGGTEAVKMPSGTVIDGSPDRYKIYTSTVYGSKWTNGDAYNFNAANTNITLSSGRYQVDIEPDGYVGSPVHYIDAAGEEKICYVARGLSDGYNDTVDSSGNINVGGGTAHTWYVAQGQTFDQAMIVNKNVHLILQDNTTLTCHRSIVVNDGNDLTIYSQSLSQKSPEVWGTPQADNHMGTIIATNPHISEDIGAGAGIGSVIGTMNGKPYSISSGKITICGGNIKATGGSGGAGIGGSLGGAASGTITIHNGIVYAEGGHFGAGIGGGDNSGASNIVISGGRVTAIGHGRAAGIGGGGTGMNASHGGGNIEISNAYVVANGGVGYNKSSTFGAEYLPTTTGTDGADYKYDAATNTYYAVDPGTGTHMKNLQYQERRIPTAIGDGIGNLVNGVDQIVGTPATVRISDAIVAVDRQYKTNVLGQGYVTIKGDVFYIEDFYNMYDSTINWEESTSVSTPVWFKDPIHDYQVILYTGNDNAYQLPQDINLPHNMTLTLQSGQTIVSPKDPVTGADLYEFNNEGAVLIQKGATLPAIIQTKGNGKVYYEIVYEDLVTSALGGDAVTIADNGNVKFNSHTFNENRKYPTSTEDYSTTIELTDLRPYGEPTKTIQVDPRPGTYMLFKAKTASNPMITVSAVPTTAARQFTMANEVVYLELPEQRLFFNGTGAILEDKVYNGTWNSGFAERSIRANGAFTAHFTPTYFYQGVTFNFEPALPAGTKLVLMDRSTVSQGSGKVYSYITTEAATSSISANDFILMMDNAAQLTTGEVLVPGGDKTVGLRLSVELPDNTSNVDAISYTVYMKDGDDATNSVKANCAADTFATVTITDMTTPHAGAISARVNVTGVVGTPNVLVVKLLDNDGNSLALPAGAQIYLDGKAPDAYSGHRFIFSGITAADEATTVTLPLTITGLTASTYKLSATVCEYPEAPNYPMVEASGSATTATGVSVAAVRHDAIKITCTSPDQVIDKAAGESKLDLTVVFSAGAVRSGMWVEVQNASGVFEKVSETAKVTVSDTYTVTATSDAPTGLYRVVITAGDAVQYLYFIVAD